MAWLFVGALIGFCATLLVGAAIDAVQRRKERRRQLLKDSARPGQTTE
jgi:hypothetical protein